METPAVHPDPLKRAEGLRSREARANRRGEEAVEGPDFGALLQNLVSQPHPLDLKALPAANKEAKPPAQPLEAKEAEVRAQPEAQEAPKKKDQPEAAAKAESRADTPERPSKPTAEGNATGKTAKAAPEARPQAEAVPAPEPRTETSPVPSAPAAPVAPEVARSQAIAPKLVAVPEQGVGTASDGEVLRLAEAIGKLAGEETQPAETKPVPEAKAPLVAKAEAPALPRPAAEPAKPVLTDTSAPVFDHIAEAPGEETLDVAKALAAEDKQAELESQRMHELERRRGIDEARIQSLVDRQGKAAPAAAGQSGSGAMGDQGRGGQPNPDRTLVQKAQASTSTPQALSGLPAGPEASPRAESVRVTPRARAVAHAVLEQAREMARSRQTESGKLSLTIQLDESTEIKLRITPRNDGTHELAFMIADPKLRDELQRALPEIRSTASELPIDVSDVWIGDATTPLDERPDSGEEA